MTACDSKQGSEDVSAKVETKVVFRSEDGKVLTSDDLKAAEGQVSYEIPGVMEIPEEARRLHQEARQLGASGGYMDALEKLAKARALAPSWPYPVYDSAFTYLMMNDFAKARELYGETMKLSPRGFFTAITALDALNREASGDLPVGTYLAYLSIEWIDDPAQKAKMARSLVEKCPGFAPAWKSHAVLCEDPEERIDALEKGLAANPDKETKGILLINKALHLSGQGEKGRAIEILGSVALDRETTLGNEHLAKQALAMITGQSD